MGKNPMFELTFETQLVQACLYLLLVSQCFSGFVSYIMSCTRNQTRSSRGRRINRPKCDCGCESGLKTHNGNDSKHQQKPTPKKKPQRIKKAQAKRVEKEPEKTLKVVLEPRNSNREKSSEKVQGKTSGDLLNVSVVLEPLSSTTRSENGDGSPIKSTGKVQTKKGKTTPLDTKPERINVSPIKSSAKLQSQRDKNGKTEPLHTKPTNINVNLIKPSRKPQTEKDKKGTTVPLDTKSENTIVSPLKPQDENKKGKTVPLESSTPIKKPARRNVPKVTPEARESLPKPPKLRTRQDIEYADSSLEETVCNETLSTKKLPIYRQQQNENKQKRPIDDYEFDSDSENTKKQKRKKSEVDDASLENFLSKAVEKKTKTTVKKPRKRNGKKKQIIIDEVSFNPKTGKFVNNVKKAIVKTEPEKKTSFQSIEVPRQDVNNSTLNIISSDESTSTINFQSPRVKILSDVHLTPRNELFLNIASPNSFRNVSPNANSTMVNNKVLTPWRFNDINIRRNPHFLTLKKSSLPCISQEMVLDHTMVDRLNESSRTYEKQPVEKSVQKQLVQATLHDYLDCNKENEENHNVSLFDYDQFSPVKNRSKLYNVPSTPKRRILGEKNENQVVSSTVGDPISPKARSPKKNNEVDLNFGFDSEDEGVDSEKTKNEGRKPFRLSVNLNDKKYQPKRKVKFQRNEAESVVESEEEEEESSEEEEGDGDNENKQCRLFEDFDTTTDCLEMKQRKRKFDGDYREKPKRRKDLRTKDEEEEAEKWYRSFNSMCAEIEEFPLEIE